VRQQVRCYSASHGGSFHYPAEAGRPVQYSLKNPNTCTTSTTPPPPISHTQRYGLRWESIRQDSTRENPQTFTVRRSYLSLCVKMRYVILSIKRLLID